MPLTPLSPDNTPRVLIQYTSGGLPHTLDLRVAHGTTKAGALSDTNDVIAAMLPCMANSDSVTGALWIPEGSNVAQTMPVTVGAGSGGSVSASNEAKTVFISATGRSDDGHKVRWTFFTLLEQDELVFRKLVSATASVFQALYAEISGNTFWRTISGESPAWHSYFNIGLNAHFQRSQR